MNHITFEDNNGQEHNLPILATFFHSGELLATVYQEFYGYRTLRIEVKPSANGHTAAQGVLV